MKTLLVILLMLFTGVMVAAAQTDTPVPTNTPLPSATPFPTYHWPTLTAIPALSLTPKVWATPTRPVLGTAFHPPPPPDLSIPDLNTAPGFDPIGEKNSISLFVYIVYVIVAFYGWLVVNASGLMRAMRIFTIIIMVLYGLYLIWKDSRYYPNSSGQGTFLEDYRTAARGGFRGGVRASQRERAWRERIARRNRSR